MKIFLIILTSAFLLSPAYAKSPLCKKFLAEVKQGIKGRIVNKEIRDTKYFLQIAVKDTTIEKECLLCKNLYHNLEVGDSLIKLPGDDQCTIIRLDSTFTIPFTVQPKGQDCFKSHYKLPY